MEMGTWRYVGVGLVAVFAYAGCGDDEAGTTSCGDGTVLQNGICVPSDDPLDCGPGTSAVDGECLPDGTPLDCGEGTFEFDGQCVNYDPDDTTPPTVTATPPGGDFRTLPAAVGISANEPATVYYTTDGTDPTAASTSSPNTATITDVTAGLEVRYFAIDLAGNESAIESATFTEDLTGPEPVTGLLASRANTDVTVNWTNPADYQGIVIARGVLGEPPQSDPVPGVFYTVGDTLPGGESVIFAGDGAAATDILSGVGFNSYGAWAHDAAGNYSPRAISNPVGIVALPTQTATLSVDLTTETVTVSTQPGNFTLSGTASYDDPSDALTVTLTAQNDNNRVIHALKAGLVSVNEGTGDGIDFAGGTVWHFGLRGTAPGMSRSTVLSFSSITGGTNPILIDLNLRDSPIWFEKDDIHDASGVADFAEDTDINGSEAQTAVDALSRFAVYGEKNTGVVQVLDLTTHVVSTVSVGDDGSGHISGVAISSSRIYALHTTGGHWHASDGEDGGEGSAAATSVQLYAINPETLEIEASLELAPSSGVDLPVGGDLALSDDGTTLLAPITHFGGVSTNELWVIDATTMTIIDTDAGTAGDQPVALSPAGRVNHVLWQPNGARAFVSFHNPKRTGPGDGTTPPSVDVVDAATYAVTQLTPATPQLAGGIMAFAAGKLYYPHYGAAIDRVTIFDIAGATQANFDEGDYGVLEIRGVNIIPGGTQYLVTGGNNNCGMAIVNLSDDTPVADNNESGACANRYNIAISPF